MLALKECRGLPANEAWLVQPGRPALLARMALPVPPAPKAIPASQVRQALLAQSGQLAPLVPKAS